MSILDIDTDEVRRHADKLEIVRDRVDDARGAAGQVSMEGEAYGILCSPFLVPVLASLEQPAIAAMLSAATALDGTAGSLRAMATALDAVDRSAAGAIRKAGEAPR